MMMECPRCGFVQPKDQYCANCGLNVESFNPKPPPVYKKVWKSYAPIISIALLIVLVALTFNYIKKQESLKDMVPKENLDEKYGQFTENEASTLEETNTKKPIAKNAKENMAVKQIAPTNQASSNSGLIESNTIKTVSTLPTKVQILFVEGIREWGLDLISRGESVGQDLRMSLIDMNGKLLDKANEFESKQQLQKLGSARNTTLTPNQNIRFNFTTPHSGTKEELGLFLDLIPISISESATLIDIKGFVHLIPPETGGGDPYQFPIQEQVEIPHGKTLIITSLLPHYQLKSDIQDNLSATPLKVLNSAEYKAQGTDFYIMVQPQP